MIMRFVQNLEFVNSHRFTLIDSFKLVKRAPYRIPYKLVAEDDRQIDLLFAEGKLVPVACTPRRAKLVGFR